MEKITTTTVWVETNKPILSDGVYMIHAVSGVKIEKKEEMVCMSKEDLIKTIYDSIAWSANDSLSLSKRPSDKKIQTFINNLFK